FLAARPSEVVTSGLDDVRATEGGWWVGWLSYDMGREIERLPSLARDELTLPPLALARYDAHLEFDHARGEVRVCGHGDARHLLTALGRGARVTEPGLEPAHEWTSSLPSHEYERAVRRAIDYIRAGDVFQVNL